MPGSGPASACADRLAYSVPEAAKALGLSRDVIYGEIRAGRLESLKVGRRRIITRMQIDEFLTRLGQLYPSSAADFHRWGRCQGGVRRSRFPVRRQRHRYLACDPRRDKEDRYGR